MTEGPAPLSPPPASTGTAQAPQSAPERLPFRRSWPFAAGMLTGICLRMIFSGKPGGVYTAMTASFIYLAPFLVAAVTVYVAERSERRAWSYYMTVGAMSNLFFVLGALLIMIEGVICAIVIVPLFMAIGVFGGLLMGILCRMTNWPRRELYCLGALPLLLGAIETRLPAADRIRVVERSVVIDASPARVWREIHQAREIEPRELQDAWLFRIGAPLPLAGITEHTAGGLVRHIRMNKAVHFDQIVTDWKENRFVRWRYRFADDSFPAGALDEHVVLGGHYFDIEDTSYALAPRGARTELKIRMTYRVSTPFNWYADPVARALFGNLESALLDFYRIRSESAP